jgi:hypothetical protein
MRNNWFLNVDTIHTLLEGLKKNGQLNKAKVIVTLAQKRVPPFPSSHLRSLQAVLSRS